jgi:hypothetical protein
VNRVVIWRLVSSTVTDRVLARGKKSRDKVGVSEVRVLVEQSKQEALQSVLQQAHSQKREVVRLYRLGSSAKRTLV